MSAAWSRAARRAIWRSWLRVAAVVAWVEGELVARRTLPGAGGWGVMVGSVQEGMGGMDGWLWDISEDILGEGVISRTAGWRCSTAAFVLRNQRPVWRGVMPIPVTGAASCRAVIIKP